jgi:hypothetical protein
MERAKNAALGLVEVIEDLIRDMEMIALNLPDTTKRAHEFAQARRARELARAIRVAVADVRNVDRVAPLVPHPSVFGERRRYDRREQEVGLGGQERRHRVRRRQLQP